MIEIDGSLGSGGGQIMRTALGLSALVKEPIRIKRIRAGKPNPGLVAQYLTGLNFLKEITNADVEGNELKSSSFTFKPTDLFGGKFNVSIGTAGSISLFLQSIMIPGTFLNLDLRIKGGTDVKWAPPIDYTKHLVIPSLAKFGCKFKTDVLSRGYFPKGNGLVKFNSYKTKKLEPVFWIDRPDLDFVTVYSSCSNIASDVSHNQFMGVKKALEKEGIVEIVKEVEAVDNKDTSPGSVVNVIGSYGTENPFLIGGDALARKGDDPFVVGTAAASRFLAAHKTEAIVDEHFSDMIIPYLALAKGYSKVVVPKFTDHLITNIALTEQILDVKFEVDEANKIISVQGIGFKV